MKSKIQKKIIKKTVYNVPQLLNDGCLAEK